VWLSRVPAIEEPDRLVIDLDPALREGGSDFADVRWAAWRMRELLDELGLRSWVMTTGSRGLHVGVPLDAQRSFDTVRHIAQGIATVARNRYPEHLTTAHRKAARGQRVLLDIWRNAYAQTAVAPYAVRAIPGAPVATPLAWRELDRSGLNAHRYTVANVFRRLAQIDDPWAELGACSQSLDAPAERLARILEREGAYA
jgi:bifunctional non-homologous end joining protein LigD